MILAKFQFFTNLGFPEIRGFPLLNHHLGEVVWGRYNLTRWLDAWKLNLVESSVEGYRGYPDDSVIVEQEMVCHFPDLWKVKLVVETTSNFPSYWIDGPIHQKSSNLQNLCISNLSGPSVFCSFVCVLNWFMAQVDMILKHCRVSCFFCLWNTYPY